MNYSKRDVITGFIIIVLIILGIFYFTKIKDKKITNPFAKATPTSSPVQISFKKELENNFKYTIPEDRNSIELKDVNGGNSRGIATEKEILIDVDDPQTGYFYQGWLVKDDKVVSLGKLQTAKGGWLLEYDKSKNADYPKIVISLEKTLDSKIETKILEGSF